MAVAQDHRAVEAHVARGTGGHDLELGGDEVVLGDAVLLGEKGEHAGCGGALLLGVLIELDGLVAHDDVEHLAVDAVGELLGHLLCAEVGEQVADAEDGVALVLAHDHVHHGAVLEHHDAVDGERHGDPLVLLDAAIVVRVEVGDLVLLVEGVLLHIEARVVHVRAEDVEAVLERLGAQAHEHEALALVGCVDLVARLELRASGDRVLERHIAGGLGKLDRRGHALALGLVVRDERAVVCAERLELAYLLLGVFAPRVGMLHDDSLNG